MRQLPVQSTPLTGHWTMMRWDSDNAYPGAAKGQQRMDGWLARILLQGRADQREVTQHLWVVVCLCGWLSFGALTGWTPSLPSRIAARRHLTAGEVGVCRDELLLVVLIAARGRRGLPCQGQSRETLRQRSFLPRQTGPWAALRDAHLNPKPRVSCVKKGELNSRKMVVVSCFIFLSNVLPRDSVN
jgi:hypothetical protein